MDIYQTEDEQVEALKKWWQENGKSALFGVVLGLMAIFGWREWKEYHVEQAAAASQVYQQMVIAWREDKPEAVSKNANEIASRYQSTAYAVFAKLALAKLAVNDGDLKSAASHLQWALDNTSRDSLRHVISLRLARVLTGLNRLAEAKALITGKADRGEFRLSYQELEGDILRLEGDIAAAREAYETALNEAQISGQDTVILEMKLDDLGRVETQ